MPGLLGILLLGILFRNISIINRNLFINDAIGSLLRKFAFLIILLRAGLGLDAKALMELKGACVFLAFLPCTFEAFTVAIASWLIFKINFSFGLLLGFVLAAVSPAVIVPAMLELRTKRLGIDKGIPTLINAAASIDDVYAITWFSLILSSITSGSEDNSSQIWTIIRAPLEVIGGIILGGILGVILWIFPDPKLTSIKLRRISLLLSLSFSALFGTEYLGLETVGPIAVLILGFTAAFQWRQLSRLECLKEEKLLKNAWDYIGLPFLFCLIGYQLNLEQVKIG
uniref:Cation/H+ exchanger domain-containing protein n=1 Tax=Panagrolaimus davidi TaxID=227884 RepID=A0A914QDD9_9BILA